MPVDQILTLIRRFRRQIFPCLVFLVSSVFLINLRVQTEGDGEGMHRIQKNCSEGD